MDSPWASRTFTRWFTGFAVSTLGGSMTQVALAFSVLAHAGSGADLGWILAANTATAVALTPLAGVLADRLPRARVLVGSHVGSGLAQAGTATVLLTGHYALAPMVALAALSGVFGAFTSPAARGLLPELVPAQALGRANSARTTARAMAKIAGPSAAGVLVATAGGPWALVVDAVSFLVAAVLFATLRLRGAGGAGGAPAAPARAARPPLRTDFADGWATFVSMPWLVVGTSAFLVINIAFTGLWQVLGPLLASRGVGAVVWGTVLSARSVGMLAGGVGSYRVRPRRPLVVAMAGPAGTVLPFLALLAGGGAWWLWPTALVAGVGSAVADVAWETTLQRAVPTGAMSRVASIDEFVSYTGAPLGQAAAAPLAALLGPVGAVTALVCVLGGAVAGALAAPSVRAVPADRAGPADPADPAGPASADGGDRVGDR